MAKALGDSVFTKGTCSQCAGADCSTQATRGPGWRPVSSQPPARAPGTGCMNPQARQTGCARQPRGRSQAGGRQLASAGGATGPWTSSQRGHAQRGDRGTGGWLVPIRAPPPTCPLLQTRSTHKVQGPAQGLSFCSGSWSTTYLHSLSSVGFNFIFQSYSFQFILQALDFHQPRRVLWAQ